LSRTSSVDPQLLGLRLQAGGPLGAQALADAVGVSRVTIQRTLRQLGSSVVQLGKTRNTRYALRRDVLGQRAGHGFSRLSQNGIAHEWGTLTALHGGWLLEWASPAMRPDWADQVHDHAGFCDGLPFFLADLRPQGFLGRATARRLPGSLGLPLDPREWSDDQTLFYLREWGDDLPGNLALGEGPTQRALNACPPGPVTPATREAHYPSLAEQANAGDVIGSSVEGEQPKFTAWLRPPEESWVSAVLVKFTDRLDTPTGRRWADLLAAEALALEAVTWASRGDAEAGRPLTFDFADRRFYELPRFDRVGSHGRRGVVSLRALHDAGFTGNETNDWAVAAAGLLARGWISDADLRAVRLRRLFGRLIGNTDMHFGNLSLWVERDEIAAGRGRLAPVYDMLPMRWRPDTSSGALDLQPFTPDEADLRSPARPIAEAFWQTLAVDDCITPPFRELASQMLQRLRG